MTSRVAQVLNSCRGKYYCSQSLLSTYGKQYGLDKTTALKFTASLGGGVGHSNVLCEFVSVSGAHFRLGLKSCTDTPAQHTN